MIETSGHLPECPWADRGFAFPCICDRLRACEQRVRVNERDWRDQSFGLGYAAGLDAAQEAASTQRYKFKARYWENAIEAVLAAIDALRTTNP